MSSHTQDTSSSAKQKTVIQEVVLLRLLLIVLLVLYHSFAPFCGAWNPIPGIDGFPEAHFWVAKASYSFLLECFTFISGWVFGAQVLRRGASALQPKRLILSKVKRLLLPSIVFSLIYILIFQSGKLYSPVKLSYSLLEGVGHMWYLPMLFWCFAGIILVEKSKLSWRWSLTLLTLICALSILPLPLRLGRTCYYMVFFYGGYLIGKGTIDLSKFSRGHYALATTLLYAVTFIASISILTPIIDTIPDNLNIGSSVFDVTGGEVSY